MRDSRKTKAYFDKSIAFYSDVITRKGKIPPDTAATARQRVLRAANMFSYACSLLMLRYSSGGNRENLESALQMCINYWQELRKVLDSVPIEEQEYRKQWDNLTIDSYIRSFWLFSFVVCIKNSLLNQTLSLINHEGEDALLDRVIQEVHPSRKVGAKLLFPRPYQRLCDAIVANEADRPKLVSAFLDVWYPGCKEAGWYDNGRDDNSGYFGYWCFEAAAVVRVFKIDDSSFQDHPYYPADLVRFNEGEPS